MIGDSWWETSLYADEQMLNDPYWAESPEGSASLALIRQENERLQRIIDAQRAIRSAPIEGEKP